MLDRHIHPPGIEVANELPGIVKTKKKKKEKQQDPTGDAEAELEEDQNGGGGGEGGITGAGGGEAAEDRTSTFVKRDAVTFLEVYPVPPDEAITTDALAAKPFKDSTGSLENGLEMDALLAIERHCRDRHYQMRLVPEEDQIDAEERKYLFNVQAYDFTRAPKGVGDRIKSVRNMGAEMKELVEKMERDRNYYETAAQKRKREREEQEQAEMEEERKKRSQLAMEGSRLAQIMSLDTGPAPEKKEEVVLDPRLPSWMVISGPIAANRAKDLKGGIRDYLLGAARYYSGAGSALNPGSNTVLVPVGSVRIPVFIEQEPASCQCFLYQREWLRHAELLVNSDRSEFIWRVLWDHFDKQVGLKREVPALGKSFVESSQTPPAMLNYYHKQSEQSLFMFFVQHVPHVALLMMQRRFEVRPTSREEADRVDLIYQDVEEEVLKPQAEGRLVSEKKLQMLNTLGFNRENFEWDEELEDEFEPADTKGAGLSRDLTPLEMCNVREALFNQDLLDKKWYKEGGHSSVDIWLREINSVVRNEWRLTTGLFWDALEDEGGEGGGGPPAAGRVEEEKLPEVNWDGNGLVYPHRTGFRPVSGQCQVPDLRGPCHSVEFVLTEIQDSGK